jgi:hypothetical protein
MSDSDYSYDSDSSIDSIATDELSSEDDNPKEDPLRTVRKDVDRDKNQGSKELRAIADMLVSNAEGGGILHNARMEYDKYKFVIHIIEEKYRETALWVTFEKNKYRCTYYDFENPNDLTEADGFDTAVDEYKDSNKNNALNWLLKSYKRYKSNRYKEDS